MKLGILTFHRPCNFGANLQAYATTLYFQSIGHEVKVIDYVREADRSYRFIVDARQAEAHATFVQSRLPLTDCANDAKDLCRIVRNEKFDAILIGSDAVWRKPQDANIYFAQWLFDDPLLCSVPVASISPSHMGDGFKSCSKIQLEEIRSCLEKFRYIAVRDTWTKDVLNRDLFGGENYVCQINPDPVFMLPRLLGNEIWNHHGIASKRYILASFDSDWAKSPRRGWLRKLWFKYFKMAVNKAGYQLLELPVPEGKSGLGFDECIDYPIDPIQWFLWIKHARGFVGIRFHAIVSCIACGTPFYSIDSYGDNSLMNAMWTMLGMRRKARANDRHSKIRNLLLGTKLESYRTGDCIEFENPRRILRTILDCPKEEIFELGESRRSCFTANMQNLLDSISS